MSDKCYLYLFTYTDVHHNVQIRWTVTRWVSDVDQELPTLPEHLSSPSIVSVFPVFSSVFCVLFCRLLFVLLSFFLLAIVVSILLRFMASDYLFGIFKLVLQSHNLASLYLPIIDLQSCMVLFVQLILILLGLMCHVWLILQFVFWCIYSLLFESHSLQGILDTTSCDQVCQWLATGRWFSTGLPVSSPIKLSATI